MVIPLLTRHSRRLSTTTVKRVLWRVTPLKSLHHRRCHIFCIGAAKTGTTSLARMFDPHVKAAHEPETRDTVQQVIAYLEGHSDPETVRAALLARDRRLCLELESSHPLGYLAPILVETFPEAKFIVTIREPYRWLQSRLNYHIKAHPPQWEQYREYFWTQRHVAYAPEEQVLQEAGALSLDTYLSQYADHYRRVLSAIPEPRRLILRTCDLSASLDAIADFVGMSVEHLQRSHSKRFPNKLNLLEQMPESFVRAKIWHHCQPIVQQYFPETSDRYTI